MVERLGWVISVFLIAWLASRGFRSYQSRRLREAHLATHGQLSLIVVVSSSCAICPAQKSIVAKLRERYPAYRLRVDTIDAEKQPARARKLGVMTVPTTLVLGPDGTLAHINNGFTQLDVLAKQIDNLLPPNA